MNIVQHIATAIDGNQYGNEVPDSLAGFAKDNNCIIAFGYSDDNLELRGLINDEYGAWNGTSKKFIGINHLNEEVQEAFETLGVNPKYKVSFEIIADWNDSTDAVTPNWDVYILGAKFESARFHIYEDEDLFCRGIVFKVPQNIIDMKLA